MNSNPWAGRATRTAVNDRVNELVEIVGLEGKEGRVVGELAHGDQRVRRGRDGAQSESPAASA